MAKLLNAYRAQPTAKNAVKVRAYDRAHPMAACILSVVDAALLNVAIRHANRGD